MEPKSPKPPSPRPQKRKNPITKYLYEKDTIFATVWVFIFIIVLGSLPLNTYVLNPLKMGLKDFDYTDLAYAELGKGDDSLDNRIVIINIDTAQRDMLALLIEQTAAYGPKVMGLDVVFDGPREPFQDSLLAATLSAHKNIIVATKFDWQDTASPYKQGHFAFTGNKQGYVNMLAEDIATIRLWSPFFENETDKKAPPYKSFAASIVEEYDPAAFKKMQKRKKKSELINFTRRAGFYQIIEPEMLLTGNVDTSALKGKIALLGYIGRTPYDIEDKKFTPMNPRFAGKSIPDMNGIVVHANIISMILDKNYIKKLPSWVNWLVAIIIGWLHMSFFVRYYLEKHIWFHLVAKLAQVISAILFAYLAIYLFDRFNVKLDVKMTLIVIVMAVDVIYFYEAWASWMHKKYNYKTIFKPHHH